MIIAIGRSSILYRSLEHLIAQGHTIGLIVTAKEYAEYRHGAKEYRELAEQHNIPFLETTKLRAEEIMERTGGRPAFGISVNWQFLIPKEVIDLCTVSFLNMHCGRLPDYKGNATANWAILEKLPYLNVDVHHMVPELDAGDIVARHRFNLDGDSYVGDIMFGMEDIVPGLFEEAIQKLSENPNYIVTKNSAHGLRCYPRRPEDGLIDWKQPAEDVRRLIRAAGAPYPGAFSFLHSGEKITIWRAKVSFTEQPYLAVPGGILEFNKTTGGVKVACGEGVLELEEISVNNGEPIAPASYLKSIRARLGGGGPIL